MADDDVEAPGWNAITAVFDRLHAGQEPRHVGYPPGLAFGAGLQGCSAYRADGHWHYVTYGLTELWAKEEGSRPEVSGWGYELTLRLAAAGDAAEAPGWPFGLLEAIARHTRQQAHPFAVGDRLDMGGPITSDQPTRLEVLAFVVDPEAGTIDTPNGAVEFRQVVGVTRDELAEMQATSTAAVLDRLAVGNPRLATDPSR